MICCRSSSWPLEKNQCLSPVCKHLKYSPEAQPVFLMRTGLNTTYHDTINQFRGPIQDLQNQLPSHTYSHKMGLSLVSKSFYDVNHQTSSSFYGEWFDICTFSVFWKIWNDQMVILKGFTCSFHIPPAKLASWRNIMVSLFFWPTSSIVQFHVSSLQLSLKFEF